MAIAPGWYPDPWEPGSLRYWDGDAWADNPRTTPPLPDTHFGWADIWPGLLGVVLLIALVCLVLAIMFASADPGVVRGRRISRRGRVPGAALRCDFYRSTREGASSVSVALSGVDSATGDPFPPCPPRGHPPSVATPGSSQPGAVVRRWWANGLSVTASLHDPQARSPGREVVLLLLRVGGQGPSGCGSPGSWIASSTIFRKCDAVGSQCREKGSPHPRAGVRRWRANANHLALLAAGALDVKSRNVKGGAIRGWGLDVIVQPDDAAQILHGASPLAAGRSGGPEVACACE